MRVIVHAAPRDAARAAAALVAEQLSHKPDSVLALPTGRTSVRLYQALVDLHRRSRASFASARWFNLDEFHGIAREDARSFAAFLDRNFLSPIAVKRDRVRLLDGATRNWRLEAAAFDRSLDELGGLDVAIIGIGTNGHIAFNEPGATLVAETHRVRLTTSSRAVFAPVFGSTRRVPTHALTMGIGTILRARRVILLATGATKTEIVHRALEGPVTTRVPGSLLQLHGNADVVLDRAAASALG